MKDHPRTGTLVCLLLALWPITTAALEVYRWRDAKGVTHFSDEPHPGAERIRLPEQQSPLFVSTVDRVIDGDTLRLGDGTRVRLLGIDAPEVPFRGRPGEPGALEATRFLKRLVEGHSVRLVTHGEDRYGRLLAQLTLGDGRDANRQLLGNGHAVAVATGEPSLDDLHFSEERRARLLGRGIWSLPAYQVFPVKRAAGFRNSFRRLRGRVTGIVRGPDRLLVRFGTNLQLEVTEETGGPDLETLRGHEVTVGGYIRQREGTPTIRLAHPLRLEHETDQLSGASHRAARTAESAIR